MTFDCELLQMDEKKERDDKLKYADIYGFEP